MYRNTYIEIDTNIISSNVKNIIKKYNDYKYYIGVVKGNAYGHGGYISKTMIENGINYLAVSSLEEATDIRKYVDTPILSLEPISLDYIDECIKNNVTITISNYDYYKKLISKNIKGLKVHLKLNTGLNRLGLSNVEEVTEIYNNLINNENIKLEGIYSHLSTTGIADKIYDNQIARFKELTKNIDLNKIEIVHIGKSSTLEYHPKIEFVNAIRLGGALYGIKQPKINYTGLKGFIRKLKHNYLIKKLNISETYKSNDLDIKPAISLKSEVMEIQKIKAGDIVGYGGKFVSEKDALIAVIPVGYADGLDLRYNNCYVTINSKKYKIVGSVNMGMITVLIDESIQVGDEVSVINKNIKEIASLINSTPYFVMTSLNPTLPRIYKKDNKIIKIVE